MKVEIYSLAINGEPVVEITVDVPRWLPVRPVADRQWLRPIVAAAVRDYFCSRGRCPAGLLAQAARI